MIRIISLLSLLCFMIPAQASDYYYCQTGKYVYLGYTAQQVEQACGTPKSKNTAANAASSVQNQITEWIYSMRPTKRQDIVSRQTKRRRLMVDMKQGKVIALRVAGQSVTSTTYCSNNPHHKVIRIGDFKNDISRACGQPNLVNQRIAKNNKQILWSYQTNSYAPVAVLSFENGKLINIAG